MSAIVAYTERQTVDPMTCEEGVLREEWRLVPFSWSNPEHMAARLWDHRSNTVLQHRYIRRGTVEPWVVVECCADERKALESIDGKAVAVDRRLAEMQVEREERRRQHEAELREREKRAAEEEKQQHQREESEAAFCRLLAGKDKDRLAARWLEFTVRWKDNAEQLAKWREDSEFMGAYRAVLDAVTVPKKRVAIREFLARYEND